MHNNRLLTQLKSDLNFIQSRLSEFMLTKIVNYDNPLLADLIIDYENVRDKLIKLDPELFGSLKNAILEKPIKNEYASDKPFYTGSSFNRFRKEVNLALKNFIILENEEVAKNQMMTTKQRLPFLSISFDKKDKNINEYFKDILKALQIDFETGEKYSKDSIPEKVKKRIENTDLIIVIFVKRDELTKGGYVTPAWLIKELSHAQANGKEVIALVEEGINDIAGLKMEKEIIPFKRDHQTKMLDATIKFLEALKEHGLV